MRSWRLAVSVPNATDGASSCHGRGGSPMQSGESDHDRATSRAPATKHTLVTDLGLRLLRHGYDAIERDRVHRSGAATYVSRMLGRRAVVLGGERGARVFYDEDVVERKGAVPPPLAWLLFGRGAVHGLDDGEHQARKTMFLDLLGPAQVAVCADLAEQRLRTAVDGWGGRRIDLQNELVESYGAAALTWAGVDAEWGELRRRSHQYARIVDGFGFSPTYPRSWVARVRTDR